MGGMTKILYGGFKSTVYIMIKVNLAKQFNPKMFYILHKLCV